MLPRIPSIIYLYLPFPTLPHLFFASSCSPLLCLPSSLPLDLLFPLLSTLFPPGPPSYRLASCSSSLYFFSLPCYLIQSQCMLSFSHLTLALSNVFFFLFLPFSFPSASPYSLINTNIFSILPIFLPFPSSSPYSLTNAYILSYLIQFPPFFAHSPHLPLLYISHPHFCFRFSRFNTHIFPPFSSLPISAPVLSLTPFTFPKHHSPYLFFFSFPSPFSAINTLIFLIISPSFLPSSLIHSIYPF